MSASRTIHTESERESLRVAEAARQAEWKEPSFLKEIFLGNLQMHLIRPIPDATKERPEFTAFFERLRAFLRDRVNPGEIDATGEYPNEVVDGLKRLGAFGMKIPAEYGGLGFSQVEYGRVMELLGSYDGNLSALISAHQSIGVAADQAVRHRGAEGADPPAMRGRGDLGVRADRDRRRLRPG